MLIYLLGIDGGKITYDIAGCASLGPDFATKIGLMYRPLLCATLNGQENVRIVVCTYQVPNYRVVLKVFTRCTSHLTTNPMQRSSSFSHFKQRRTAVSSRTDALNQSFCLSLNLYNGEYDHVD